MAGNKYALIVDDEPLVTIYLEDVMSQLGFSVLVAGNEDRARSIVAGRTPDVALLDVNLNGAHEGIGLAKWLREAHSVAVVFITGNTDRNTLGRIEQVVPGAPVLSKPVVAEQISKAVATVMSKGRELF
jgi:DNA-binding response OmpR family regulator